jgi:Asp/Glu/Hydantoin racemase
MSAKRIFLIHATRVAMDPVNAAFAQLWPEARCFNLWDDSLSQDASDAGQVTPALSLRIRALAKHAVKAHADGILFTCSSFSDAIEACQKEFSIPILKPNEAMVREALEIGGRVAALTTFIPAGKTIVEDFDVEGDRLDAKALVTPVFCEGALELLKSGDVRGHDEIIARVAASLAGKYDVLCFAQFSMTTAVKAAEEAFGARVLTTPGSAVSLLQRRLG